MPEMDIGRSNADNKSISSKGENKDPEKNINTCSRQLSAKTGSMRESVHLYPQEAELGLEEGGKGPPCQRLRGDFVYTRCGTQSAGAFRCSCEGREGERPSRCPLSYSAGNIGHRRCSGEKTGEIKVRNQETNLSRN